MTLKEKLYEKCTKFVKMRLEHIQQANLNASESAKDETKSSSGDKHETGKAMAQLEQEKNSKQLSEATDLKMLLSKINPHHFSDIILPGSLVVTNKGDFYISIGAGKLTVDDKIYFAISPVSPIGKKLMRLKRGATIDFNGNNYKIQNVL